ncbi:hypothetical protein I547_6502 [Mycobacterium kansasii 824]|uniref:Uncharacterized protein n=1 Tax=Mycobacterium kansasii TaxID=1768 RepID=A0A1V3XDC7_MYCKA|nr:hypothetical protein I547_6502 [Mycobacterium kansasii 824]OOK77213.1 hypothetical protein BZL29_3208 [Mycobacterium kansasii]
MCMAAALECATSLKDEAVHCFPLLPTAEPGGTTDQANCAASRTG